MSLRAASAGRLALQSRLLARTNAEYGYNYSHHHRRRSLLSGSANELHTFASRLSLEDNKSDDRDDQRRLQVGLPAQMSMLPGNSNSNNRHTNTAIAGSHRCFYHTTPPQERAVAIILGAGALSASFYAASSAITAYKEYKASIPDTPPEEENVADADKSESESAGTKENQQKEEAQQKEKGQPAGERENIFTKWFGVGVGAKYYEGGFEETMTRREAALILGIRESSSAKRIKDAHRKLLILNHPDTGGSTYMSLKINEAKELLLKGKGRV